LKSLIEKTKQFVSSELENDKTGHDYWHSIRVWRNAKFISMKENVKTDLLVVELAALLHDIEDWKSGSKNEGKIIKWLIELGINDKSTSHICEIISHISFKGLGVDNEIISIEGKIVQDADRLDAIGAIGIARAFAYGGNKNRNIYDPEEKAVIHKSFNEYKNSQSCTINHFHEKLLHLKDLMNTQTAKQLAEDRHKIMTDFLDNFLTEWDLNCKSYD
jgi:uncharacterized protein